MIHTFEQGSDEWRQYKCGRISGSRLGDLMARGKSGPSATRKNYLAELVVERMTGTPTEHYTSREMQWGTDHEPEARALYEFERDTTVRQVGFIDHPSLADAGVSPDGLVGEDGAIEIKCPNTAKHIETLTARKIDRGYMLQMQWVMECDDRSWCDFVSYDPRMPTALQLCIIRVDRDNDTIHEIRKAVEVADREVNDMVLKLRQLIPNTNPTESVDNIF